MVIDMFNFKGMWKKEEKYKKGDYVTIKDDLREGHGFVAIKDPIDSPFINANKAWIEHVPLPSEIRMKAEE